MLLIGRHLLHKGCLWWWPVQLIHSILVELGPVLYPGPKAAIVLFSLILGSQRPERLLWKQQCEGELSRGASVVLGTCRWASMSGSAILRFHFDIYRIRQLNLWVSSWGLAVLWSAKNSGGDRPAVFPRTWLTSWHRTLEWPPFGQRIKTTVSRSWKKKNLALCHRIPSLALIPPSCVALAKSHYHS